MCLTVSSFEKTYKSIEEHKTLTHPPPTHSRLCRMWKKEPAGCQQKKEASPREKSTLG